MGLLSKIGNVASGRYAHWNDTNNATIADMWGRAEQFPTPTRVTFQAFIASSASLVDALLGPDKGRERMIERDPKRVSRQQFARIHSIILESLAGMFVKLNPPLHDSSMGALAILTGRNPDASKVIQTIESLNELDAMTIGAVAWTEIVHAAGSDQGTSTLDALPFASTLGVLAEHDFEEITTQLRP